MKDLLFPTDNNCNLDSLVVKERSLKAAYKVSVLCNLCVFALCITAVDSSWKTEYGRVKLSKAEHKYEA
jgi:hypothetical protein